MKRIATLGVLALLGVASRASALVQTGPVYAGAAGTPVSGATCNPSPALSATSGPSTLANQTVVCSAINQTGVTNLYYGLRHDSRILGDTETGLASPISNTAARWLFSSVGAGPCPGAACTITYTGTTQVTNNNLTAPGSGPVRTVTTKLILSLTAVTGGTGSIVAAGGNPADSPTNGDTRDLFKITGTSFTVQVQVQASDSDFPTAGPSSITVFNASHGQGPTTTKISADISQVDLGFYYSTCGDGILDSPAEACDDGSAFNGTSGSCCNANCTAKLDGTNCTGAASDCASTTGTCASAVCSRALANGTPCTSDNNPCTVDRCNGVSILCQHPAGNSGAACPDDGNFCTQDVCDGLNTVCQHPAAIAGTLCRAATDLCDLTEICTGTSTSCPNDAVKTAGTVCSVTAGSSDLNCRVCDGVNKPCTATLAGGGTSCRVSGGACDLPESCTVTNANCPADAKRPSSYICNASTGGCDPAEFCTGSTNTCPTNVISPNGTVCRASQGVCDVAETCDGTSTACPADAVNTNTATVCRAFVPGGCDIAAETCDGVNPTCPADTVRPVNTVCRASVGTCDVAEVCDGTHNTCPFNVVLPVGTS